MSIFKNIFNNNITTEDFADFKHPLIDYKKIVIKSQAKSAINLIISIPFACSTYYSEIEQAIGKFMLDKWQISQTICEFKPTIIAHKVKQGLKRNKCIKNIIAITAGKGGVGKSTTAINLAISLAKNGASVGLLDADIYGPSLPILIGETSYKPEVKDNLFVPIEKYGIKAMSFGFLIADNQPAIWRGAIVNKALEQMLFDTAWDELDYLIIDMPPGTGDIHLTMCQKIPLTANIVITTPQDIALLDVTKSIEMYNKMTIPCIGIVENMSIHICEKCNHQSEIFGHGAADKLVKTYNYSLLAKLPLDISICKQSDVGTPIALQDNPISQIYNELAIRVGQKIATLPKDYTATLPNIQVIP